MWDFEGGFGAGLWGVVGAGSSVGFVDDLKVVGLL